jgi:hypothetical protein
MTEQELHAMAFQLAAMRNQVDAMMLTVEGAIGAPRTKGTKTENNESSELDEKVRSYFGGLKESPDNPQSGS